MRVFHILTAILVAAAVYMLVIQRDALFDLAGRSEAPEQVQADGAAEVPAPEPETAEEPVNRIRVVAMDSAARDIDTAVLVRGRTEAARQVDARAETSGLVVNEPLRKGALVEAGDLLCEIDPGTRMATLAEARARLKEAQARVPEAAARVDEARARLNEAEINDRAARSLSQSGFAAETRVAATAAAVSSAQAGVESARTGLESAETAVQGSQAAVAAAETEIDRLTITAPFGGLLESDTAELGTLLQPGQVCATVIQLDPIRLVGFVPEADIERVTPGANAGADLASGGQLVGTVTYASRSADEETRTFRVEITVPNPNLTVRDGQTAEIAIASDGAPAHLIPASALTLDDEGHLGVRLAVADEANSDVAAFAAVELVRDSTDGVYVTGLPDPARVIIVGQEYITDGVPLDVTLRNPAEEAIQ
ncbi:MAG: efflux RND transporter periplasmic adaptor subunit [Pseudomonadota bacterium]